jgi:hypothetical protein
MLSVAGCNSSDSVNGDFSVSLKVVCNEVVSNFGHEIYGIKEDKIDIVPDDGIILDIDTFCDEGENAFNLLINSLKAKKIHFEADDGYLTGISNIYVGDCGANSGWMFFINGELAELGAPDTILNDGDEVEFRYVVDYMTLFQ